MRSGVLKHVDNGKKGRGRPKLTWDESVKRDLKDWNISKEIVLDRNAWRLAINVPEQQQQHSLFSQASWGRLDMKPERNKFKVQAH